ncbi:hypothetical protein OC846_002837 [Tilletia horrida]|uniref:FAD-binding domain-containing protein n=1 Tax=Tilletia horrida TaxID=155126 RepID=A0AAN6GWA2_9BASI|nr:hypothetical protein OC846_002837 [Tilletia horrida]
MSNRRVLISGAGIAGPVVAHWLGRAGISSTIVERSPTPRTSGQTIDIRGAARTVMTAMGVEDEIRANCTKEEGMYFVNANDQVQGAFPVDHENGNSGTCDIEILRYKLASIFCKSAEKTTTFIYGDAIKNITQTESEAIVDFESGKTQAFDVIVLADGMHSRARSLVFPKEGKEGGVEYRPAGFMICYFQIPYSDSKDGDWSRWWIREGSRSIWIRPDGKSDEPSSRVFLMTCDPEALEKLRNYRSLDIRTQKQLWRELFAGGGWQTDRVLNAMDADDDSNFYMQDVAQVKASKWYSGRVVLVGDAGYCPSPLSGMGTSVAIAGSYVLANELAKLDSFSSITDLSVAFTQYENICRPYVEKAQDAPFGLIKFAYQKSWFGIRMLYFAIKTISFVVKAPGFNKLAGLIFGDEPEEEKLLHLPEYPITSRSA